MRNFSRVMALAVCTLSISSYAKAQVWAYPGGTPGYTTPDLRPPCFGPGHVIWPDRRGEIFGPWREDIYVDAPIDRGDFPRPVPCTHHPLQTEGGPYASDVDRSRSR